VKNIVFGLIILALALVGLAVYMGEQKADKMFAQEIADQLTGVTQTQAEALLKAQEVQDKLAELNMLYAQEQIREARARRWLADVGTATMTILTLVFLVLAVIALRTYRERRAAKDGAK
jgi:ABC-type multidrug transport system fused ATPase/permease subunit